MSIEIFLLGITLCSVFTSVLTEAVKTMFTKCNKNYNSNIIAAVCSVLVAVIVSIVYAVISKIAVDSSYYAIAFLLCIFSWIGSMIGYDKIIQTIKQLTSKK